MVNYGTSYHALVDRAKIKKNEVILILGASGGVGTAAIQIAKEIGAIVIAAASSKEKLDYCKKMGADYCINYTSINCYFFVVIKHLCRFVRCLQPR